MDQIGEIWWMWMFFIKVVNVLFMFFHHLMNVKAVFSHLVNVKAVVCMWWVFHKMLPNYVFHAGEEIEAFCSRLLVNATVSLIKLWRKRIFKSRLHRIDDIKDSPSWSLAAYFKEKKIHNTTKTQNRKKKNISRNSHEKPSSGHDITTNGRSWFPPIKKKRRFPRDPSVKGQRGQNFDAFPRRAFMGGTC